LITAIRNGAPAAGSSNAPPGTASARGSAPRAADFDFRPVPACDVRRGIRLPLLVFGNSLVVLLRISS